LIYLLDNDTSGEFTKNEIKHVQKLKYYTSKENSGFAKGMNILLKKAQNDDCKYVLILNNDTVVLPTALHEYVDCFVNNPDCGLASSIVTYDKHPKKIWFAGGALYLPWYITQHRYMNQHIKVLKGNLLYYESDWISGCAMMCQSFQRLDEAYFAYVEDVDLSLEIRKLGKKCLIINKPLIRHLVSSSIGNRGSNFFTDQKIKLQAKNSAYLIRKYHPQFSNILIIINSILQILIYTLQHRLLFRKIKLFFQSH
jgi:hypothetical protein